MAFSTGGRGPFSGQMNVTPLIDVLLVLIIMFMVVVSMSKEYVTDAQIPQPAAKNTPDLHPERTIVIQVEWNQQARQPELKINKEVVAWDDLGSRLHLIYLGRLEKVAYVKGDDDLDFEYVAQVIAEAHNAGVERVGLLTKRESF
jgi:biopolymer transport protein TolR